MADPRRRGQPVGLGVFLLAQHLLNDEDVMTPPVTLAAVFIQLAVYLGFFPNLHPDNTRECLALAALMLAEKLKLVGNEENQSGET